MNIRFGNRTKKYEKIMFFCNIMTNKLIELIKKRGIYDKKHNF